MWTLMYLRNENNAA